MIFPFYRDGELSYDQKLSEYNVPMDHSLIQTKSKSQTDKILPSKKLKSSSDGLEWLKKKSGKFEQIQRFNQQNTTRNKNFCQLPLAKFVARRKHIFDQKQTQNTAFPKQKQKRFHTESQLLDNKRKTIYLDKTFNQTFIDCQHNFIGKSYQKQVQKLKLNSPPSELPQSKLKLFLSATVKSTNKQKSSSFVFQKSYKPEQKSQNLFVKKRLSISDKFQIKKSKTCIQQTPTIPQKHQSINIRLRRQIQKSVKDDIKAQLIKFKKSKLNKFKFKEYQIKKEKKSLQIQQTQNLIQKVSQQKQFLQQHPSKFLTQYNCQIKFRGSKVVQVIKKSHSSFNGYQTQETKIHKKIYTAPIYENLDPWEGQSTQFYGFR